MSVEGRGEKMIECKQIHEFVKKTYPSIKMVEVNPNNLIFEERVKLNCFYCARYNMSWRCPPKIPVIDYKKVLSEFKTGAFVYDEVPLNEATYSDVRTDSTVMIHRALLQAEKYLLKAGNSMYLSFIGGSCKLCKNGCGKEKCNNPYLARIPLEATGVNVVASALQYDIKITFPVEDHITRIGFLLW